MMPADPARFADMIHRAENGRHKLVFVIGESGAGKTALLAALSSSHSFSSINLGAQLGSKLLGVAPRMRPLAIDAAVEELVEPGRSGVCVDNTDVLFAPTLRCNPLRLAYNISQNRVVIYALNGRLEGERFIRGYPDHPEYFCEEIPIIPTVFLDRGTPIFYNS